MSTNPIGSLPQLPPQEMSAILADSAAMQAFGDGALARPAASSTRRNSGSTARS